MKLFKKLLIILTSIILIFGIAVFVIWGNEIGTIASIKSVIPRNDENNQGVVFDMDVKGDYYFDDFLAQGGVKNDVQLISFMMDNITKGIIPIKMQGPDIGCSAFTAKTAEGDMILARNYDFDPTSSAIISTNPSESMRSFSTVDLSFIDLDTSKDEYGLVDKAKMIANAYAPLDGINEAGLAVGIFMTYQGEETTATDQNTTRDDLTSTTMIRLILDKATTVSEAVELVKEYDLHDSANTSFHYMIADATGKSAVLEWVYGTDSTDNDGTKRELVVTYNDDDADIGLNEGEAEYQWITNFILTPDYYESDEEKAGLDRYNLIYEELAKRDGVVADEKDALSILQAVGRRNFGTGSNAYTIHSVVFNLTKKTATWVFNENFDKTDEIITKDFN